jgi:hypothetical protein
VGRLKNGNFSSLGLYKPEKLLEEEEEQEEQDGSNAPEFGI